MPLGLLRCVQTKPAMELPKKTTLLHCNNNYATLQYGDLLAFDSPVDFIYRCSYCIFEV